MPRHVPANHRSCFFDVARSDLGAITGAFGWKGGRGVTAAATSASTGVFGSPSGTQLSSTDCVAAGSASPRPPPFPTPPPPPASAFLGLSCESMRTRAASSSLTRASSDRMRIVLAASCVRCAASCFSWSELWSASRRQAFCASASSSFACAYRSSTFVLSRVTRSSSSCKLSHCCSEVWSWRRTLCSSSSSLAFASRSYSSSLVAVAAAAAVDAGSSLFSATAAAPNSACKSEADIDLPSMPASFASTSFKMRRTVSFTRPFRASAFWFPSTIPSAQSQSPFTIPSSWRFFVPLPFASSASFTKAFFGSCFRAAVAQRAAPRPRAGPSDPRASSPGAASAEPDAPAPLSSSSSSSPACSSSAPDSPSLIESENGDPSSSK
mmetsp:Transcript_12051/g.39646  ORF Transcript_12051/g.39646 Transcript_12051/m.39646 type:complete len:381 (+) Transcript_12051:861-2003(+)